MNKSRRSSAKGILFALLCVIFLSVGNAFADVMVYAEGAYTDTDLVVYVYADITAPNLCSFGVKLTYPSADLTVTSAEKNGASWYLGTEGSPLAYMDPETSTPGEIVFIGGKLDEGDPTAGVVGERVLLGKVTFHREESSMPFVGMIDIDYGRGDGTGDYKNFVAVDGTVMDDMGVTFDTVTIRERGDANADGAINAVDYVAIRNNLNSTDFPPYMDCNADGAVNVVDYVCVRNKL